MKTFVIGDIHGAHKALVQCLERSGFDKENDTLITLGDIVDGWPEVKESVDELLTIKNLIGVIGNHDVWFLAWYKTGYAEPIWTSQGGLATLDSYDGLPGNAAYHVKQYFNKCLPYYIDDKNNVFVHGGFDWHKPLDEQHSDVLTWDRHMNNVAIYWKIQGNKEDKFGDYNTVFVGHTTTQYSPSWKHEGSTEPFIYSNFVNLDTGGGWSGKLTIMDVDTKEFWQSDLVPELYPDVKGRT